MGRFSFVRMSDGNYWLLCNECYQKTGKVNLVAVLSRREQALSDFIEFAEKHNKLVRHG